MGSLCLCMSVGMSVRDGVDEDLQSVTVMQCLDIYVSSDMSVCVSADMCLGK